MTDFLGEFNDVKETAEASETKVNALLYVTMSLFRKAIEKGVFTKEEIQGIFSSAFEDSAYEDEAATIEVLRRMLLGDEGSLMEVEEAEPDSPQSEN